MQCRYSESNYKVYVYIVRHYYVLSGMLFMYPILDIVLCLYKIPNRPKAKPPTPHTCEISHLHLSAAPYTPPRDACISDW